jgi:predicted DNA-binding protein (MmcQ/YjbR family)
MSLEKLATELRAIALGYPETYEEQPWGDRVVKVRGKIFFFCGVHEGLLYATVKVPKSGRELLKRPYAEPTHYGMGKHGWVTLKFDAAKKVPVAELKGWIDESFVAVAPKKLVAPSAVRHPPSTVRSPPSAPKRKADSGQRKAILVCADKLRAKRAVDEMAKRGIGVDVVETADKVKLGKARALIVDIGRNPVEGMALAAKIDASDKPVHLFVAGVRDADQSRKLRALGSAECFRAPAGDGEVADAVAAALSRPRR